MQLAGAKKDGDCAAVDVPNGISRERGCCNLYHPKQGAQQFKCGACTMVRDRSRIGYT